MASDNLFMRGKSPSTIAQEVLDNLQNACPFSCTFIDGIPSGKRHEVEKQLKDNFRLWEQTWVRPYLEAIVAKGK